MDFPRKAHLTNVGSIGRGCGQKEIDIGATRRMSHATTQRPSDKVFPVLVPPRVCVFLG